MGRYYNGDIEGKFWFAVQNSDAASQFGREPSEPCVLYYNFDEEDLPKVESRLRALKARFKKGEYQKYKDFFASCDGYNDKSLIAAGFNVNTISERLRDFADIELGTQIRDCIKRIGQCCFEAEL